MSDVILRKIIQKTGRKPVQCRCAECKKQCRTPCLGTPQDILALIEAGHSDKLSKTEWLVGMILGKLEVSISMVQLIQTKQGWCICYNDGLCELHDLGLKPTEGKLSYHTIKAENYKFAKMLSWNVAREWISAENESAIEQIHKLFLDSK